jgi:hypothetical protein
MASRAEAYQVPVLHRKFQVILKWIDVMNVRGKSHLPISLAYLAVESVPPKYPLPLSFPFC